MKKNKFAFIGLALFSIFSLTACDFINQFFSEFYGGGILPGGNSSVVIPRISDVPTPVPGDTNANRANMIYGDLIDNSVYPMSCTPSIGKASLLVIPVYFSDSSNYITQANKEKVRQDIYDV